MPVSVGAFAASLTSLGKRRMFPFALCAALVLGGCSGPYSALDPAGPSAQSAAALWWGMFTSATVLLLGIVGLWWYAMRRTPDELQVALEAQLHNRWIIGGGVVLPCVGIVALLAFGIPAGHRMLPLFDASEPALRIDVTGHQWWWEVAYPGTAVSLVDELHIPAGVPIDIHLRTTDVIHAFWVPRLGGKLDTIPGRTNVLRLEADAPGTYYGQCAEFCGLGHSHMQLTVHAHSAQDFAAWLQGGQADDD